MWNERKCSYMFSTEFQPGMVTISVMDITQPHLLIYYRRLCSRKSLSLPFFFLCQDQRVLFFSFCFGCFFDLPPLLLVFSEKGTSLFLVQVQIQVKALGFRLERFTIVLSFLFWFCSFFSCFTTERLSSPCLCLQARYFITNWRDLF